MKTTMIRRHACIGVLAGLAAARAAATAPAVAAPGTPRADGPPAPAASAPAVADLVRDNLAARGGPQAWARTLTMVWAGHVEGSGAQAVHAPFVLKQMRPDRTRFELASQGQTLVRIFDGSSGWKLVPGSGGRPDLQPYSAEELRFARGARVIEGPLMDYAARHAAIELAGVGDVVGRKAYVLDVKLPDGGGHRVWVDAETKLELRHDRSVRSAAGQPAMVSVLFGDYREFEGLVLPTTIETRASGGAAANKLVIEKVAVNPPLDMHTFAKPATPGARHKGAMVDTRSAALPARMP